MDPGGLTSRVMVIMMDDMVMMMKKMTGVLRDW